MMELPQNISLRTIKEDKKWRNILLALFVVELFNLSAGIPYLSHICFFLTIFISIRYFRKNMSQHDVTMFGVLLLFFLSIWFLSWFFSEKVVYQSSSETNRNTTELLTPVVKFCFLYYPFYYFGKTGVITTKCLCTFIYIVLVIAMAQFFVAYRSHQAMVSTYDLKYGSSINMGYVFACAMPMIGLLWEHKKRTFYVLMFISFFFCILSAKRGAMLCALSAMTIMLLALLTKGKKELSAYFIRILLVLFLVGVAYVIFSQILESNANLQAKMEATEDGKYSGRDTFYLDLLDYWLRADFVSQLFGIKFMGAVSLVGFDAHNDWLEIVIDAGLIEAFVYLLMMIALWIYSLRNRRWLLSSEKYVMWSCAVIWLIKSFVSMGFTSADSKLYLITVAIVSGIVEARKRYKQL